MISVKGVTGDIAALASAVPVGDSRDKLLRKIETREAVVAIVGLGYVGLPLALGFAGTGFRVVGIDVDKRRVASLDAARSYIADVSDEQLAVLIAPLVDEKGRLLPSRHEIREGSESKSKSPDSGLRGQGKLWGTTNFDALLDVDAVIICVPTPLGSTKDPDMSFIVSAVEEIAQRMHPGLLVVLESTTYPGTTEELVLPRLQQGLIGKPNRRRDDPKLEDGGLAMTVDQDFFLAFSPERIDPGRTDFTVHTTPKVIGGVTPDSLQVACALYGTAIKHVVPVSSPKTAEMVKLLENTFRAVNIGLINEMAIMCDRLGIDVWEVIEAAKTKPYGFMPFYPGPGLGGHCIPIDPEYLAWKLKTLNYNARFIQVAAEVNFGMPHYVLGKIMDALNDSVKPLKGSRVLLLGIAYKADVSDVRESPALDLIHLLNEKGACVAYHDPYVSQVRIDGQVMESTPLTSQVLQAADCVVITTAHQTFEWEWILENSALVVDTRNATRDIPANGHRVVKL